MKYLRVVMFWLVGIMNTVLVRAGDMGTWKHYIGCILLLLALFETLVLIAVFLKKPGHEEVKFFFLKALAVVLPFYVVYLPQLHGSSASARLTNLWKYVFIGFLIYAFGVFIFSCLG